MSKKKLGNKTTIELRKKATSINNLILNLNFECAKKELLMLGDSIFKDYGLMHSKMHILLYDHEFEEAYELLDYMDSNHTIIFKAMILIKLNKLDELINHYYEYFYDDTFKDEAKEKNNFDSMRKIIEKTLGLPFSDLNCRRYFEFLVSDYNLEDVFRHITGRHIINGNYKYDDKFEDRTKFKDGVDLMEVYTKVKELIDENPNHCKLIPGKISNKYLIRLPGYAEDDNLKFIHAHTFFNNTDIYTIYPCKESNFPIIEPKIEENYNLSKVKKLSQIDKFNKKYKKG